MTVLLLIFNPPRSVDRTALPRSFSSLSARACPISAGSPSRPSTVPIARDAARPVRKPGPHRLPGYRARNLGAGSDRSSDGDKVDKVAAACGLVGADGNGRADLKPAALPLTYGSTTTSSA